MKRILWISTLVLILTGLRVGIVSAQQPTPSDDDVNKIARQLYCPVCENTPLDVCPTQACAQWRELIRQKLAEGWNEEQIIQYFVDNYGARVLSEPPRQGWNWLIYIAPPIIILAGAFILYRTLRSWQAPTTAKNGASPSDFADTVKGEYIARFEEELHKRG
jgi:cytochrome c-type biogenesis protein CcmH